MSQYPRRVLTDCIVIWDAAPAKVFTRKGTVIDCVPGSALELAYGGSGNLSPVIPPGDWHRSDYSADAFSKAAIANLGDCHDDTRGPGAELGGRQYRVPAMRACRAELRQ